MGVCETCDLIRVAGTAEADENRVRLFMPLAHHVEPKRRLTPMAVEPSRDGAMGRDGISNSDSRPKFPVPPVEQPRQKRKYVRRAVSDKTTGATGYEARLTLLRSQWMAEHAEMTASIETLKAKIRALEVKLEVLNDVEKNLRAPIK